ncbi:hypothetical protein KSP39_PZI010221 [Platanthera zijinensis]|uniref:Uncharacterized protein n=1 Tax=Platanthera zijinensis TaxID=2320716 RepID=A0AAP0BK91_9ASPA
MAFSHAWCIKIPSKSKPSTSPSRKKPGRSHRRLLLGTPDAGDEPLSPKVGCMGQIKRCKPPAASAPAGGFNLFVTSASFSSSGSSPGSCRRNTEPAKPAPRPARRFAARPLTSVEGIDPPLPVERKDRPPAESLWKRRSRDAGELGELQLCRPPPPAEVPALSLRSRMLGSVI